HTIRLIDPGGHEIARGLTRYDAADLTRIAGRHSRDIEGLLGFTYGPEAVHRDDLVRL
ncbi:glutamate 5-kinase, partial [Deinococcus sp. 6YEL10]|nr:glutamate 5-kinase [Deinococcus sp. 6YEL10]